LNPKVITRESIGEKTLLKSRFAVWKGSTQLLSPDGRRQITWLGISSVIVTFLELASVWLSAVTISIVVNVLGGRDLSGTAEMALEFFGFESHEVNNLILTLATISILLLVTKNLFQILLSFKTYQLLSRELVSISSQFYVKIGLSKFAVSSKIEPKSLDYIFLTALPNTIVGNIQYSIVFTSEWFVISFLSIFLIFSQPIVGITGLLLFGGLFLAISKWLSQSVVASSRNYATGHQSELQLLSDSFRPLRENILYNTVGVRSEKFSRLKAQNSNSLIKLLLRQSLPKYIYEIAGISATYVICLSGFIFIKGFQAVPSILIFIFVLSRMTPSFLRLQQAYLAIRSNTGGVEAIKKLENQLQDCDWDDIPFPRNDTSSDSDVIGIEITAKDVTFNYGETVVDTISNLNLHILPGSFVALVGPSGSGKTSIIDILLGIHKPKSGTLRLELPEIDSSKSEQIKIAYVPQSTELIHGTIKENIEFFTSECDFSNENLDYAIDSAQLRSVIDLLPEGVFTEVSPSNPKLSIGQIQRLGVARALYRRPNLLVMDESTSSLDAESEKAISDVLHKMRGFVTVVLVAHRLSTIKDADQVLYVENGRITATGKFDEIRMKIPNFDRQAKLLGL
jgi:ABC-type multidrug transport system fused ATPase/permease subunit